MAISTFMMLCNHHHGLVPEHFHHPRKRPHTHPQALRIIPSTQPPATSSLLSVCMDLPIFDVPSKWNHPVFVPLCLASFT